jgi:hypothetical protein
MKMWIVLVLPHDLDLEYESFGPFATEEDARDWIVAEQPSWGDTHFELLNPEPNTKGGA